MDEMPERGADVVEFFRLTARELASEPYTFIDVNDPSDITFAFGSIVDDIVDSNPTVHGKYKYAGYYNQERDSEADYYYTDNYFFKDNTTLDWSLASMSLALELSTWSSYDQSAWYDPRNPNALNDRLVNAKTLLLGNGQSADKRAWNEYTEADWDNWGYQGLGFDHFSANNYWTKDPEADSIGVCAATKHIAKGDREYTLVAVGIRGGGYYSEWAGNFTLGAAGEHKGFAVARDEALKWLNKIYLPSLPAEDRQRELKLWIVGYSRAGIVANMLAGAIDDNPRVITNGSVSPDNIYCYTFEALQGSSARKF